MELHFTRTNGSVDDAIDQLMELAGHVCCPELVREMILAALKAGQEETEKADLKLMNSTLKEMRFTSKVFGPYHNIRKVTVFGSARTQTEESVYKMAYLLGRKLAEAGYMVITGGGSGIMQAINEGAGPEYSFAVNIRLPYEQKPNPVVDGNPRLIVYKYFFNRKVAFLKEANAIERTVRGRTFKNHLWKIISLKVANVYNYFKIIFESSSLYPQTPSHQRS